MYLYFIFSLCALCVSAVLFFSGNYSAKRRNSRKKGVRRGLRPLRTPFFRELPRMVE